MNDIQEKQEKDRRRIRLRRERDDKEGYEAVERSAYIRDDNTYTANSCVVGGKQDDGESF